MCTARGLGMVGLTAILIGAPAFTSAEDFLRTPILKAQDVFNKGQDVFHTPNVGESTKNVPLPPHQTLSPPKSVPTITIRVTPNVVPPVPLKPGMVLPPVEFDHDYSGKITFEIVKTQEELRGICGATYTKGMLACAMTRGPNCKIVMPIDDVIAARGWTPELILRHEIGHCNGWPSDHPGVRHRREE
jgi:hypothetical protein